MTCATLCRRPAKHDKIVARAESDQPRTHNGKKRLIRTLQHPRSGNGELALSSLPHVHAAGLVKGGEAAARRRDEASKWGIELNSLCGAPVGGIGVGDLIVRKRPPGSDVHQIGHRFGADTASGTRAGGDGRAATSSPFLQSNICTESGPVRTPKAASEPGSRARHEHSTSPRVFTS